jgi:hypothetical protein
MTNKVICPSFFLAMAAAAAFSGCADTQVQNQESLLSAAGFGALTSATEAQSAVYDRVTPYKLERNTISGTALYIYADKQKGVVYVGGDKAYERYRQLLLQQSIAEKEEEASYSKYLENLDKNHSLNYE